MIPPFVLQLWFIDESSPWTKQSLVSSIYNAFIRPACWTWSNLKMIMNRKCTSNFKTLFWISNNLIKNYFHMHILAHLLEIKTIYITKHSNNDYIYKCTLLWSLHYIIGFPQSYAKTEYHVTILWFYDNE